MPSFKPISIPPNPSARRGQKVKAAQEAALADANYAALGDEPPPPASGSA